MADNVLVSNSAASSNPDYLVWTDELVDPVSGGTVQKQILGIVDATAGGTTRAAVGANGLAVSATIVGSLPANSSVNVAQLAGTTTDTNSGNKSAGTLRTVIATDQPNLTTPLNVALAANQSVNVVQVAGSAIAQGHGVAATAIRVELPTDGTGIVGLAAGANAIGKLAANGGVIIGDVNVVSAIPGVTATSLGKAEDAAHTTGDTGVMALAVRNDAGTPLAGTSGDYIPLMVNASGALYVTGGGGGTQYVEDTASAGGETMTLAGAVRQDTLASSTSADGDYAYLKVNANGALYTEVSGSISVSGTMPISVSSQYVEDAASAGGESLVLAGAVRQDTLAGNTSADGDYTYLKVSATGALYVTGGGGGSQFAEDAASTGGELMTLAGTVRSDAPAGTTSADGDYANLKTDSIGRLWVQVGASALPTGAATSAKQPALGTAGAASTDVITVQGIASGTPQPVSGTVTTAPPANASTNIAQINGVTPLMGSGNTGTGSLRVTLATDQSNLTTALNVSLASVPSHAVTNAGTFAIQDSQKIVDNATFTDGTTPVQPAGYIFDEVAGTALTENDAGAARMDSKRAQVLVIEDATTRGQRTAVSSAGALSSNLAQVAGATIAQGHGTAATAIRVELPTDGTGTVVLAAGAAAIGSVTTELGTGLTTFSNTALTNTKTAVKASAGKLYGWMIHNPAAATTYIQVWNVAIGSITVGTTAPTYVLPIPAGASANLMGDKGITHSTEINIAATTTATGSTAPATAAVVALFYI